MSEFKVTHKPGSNRFEVAENNAVAYVEYRLGDGYVDILHTIVPMQLENRGIGSALVAACYDWGRTKGLAPKGSCRFAAAWLERHKN